MLSVVAILLALILTACSGSESLQAFSGHIEATPGRHQATYTKFVGTYVYAIQLDKGNYDFLFDGSPGLLFELRSQRGTRVAELEPGNEKTISVKEGHYKLVITNKSNEDEGNFDITWKR